MQNKFTQPVSMQVTKEQYEKDLREPLLAMGYEESLITSFTNIPILVNNYGGRNGILSNICKEGAIIENRHFIPDYNPEYFLAVAAMTSEKYGIKEEWWKCVNKSDIAFLFGKLYKCICKDHTDNMPLFEDRSGNFNGYQEISHLKYFTKATLQELIQNFTENKQENQIDWEARRWELASNFYLSPDISTPESAINQADIFIKYYKQTLK